MESKRSEAKMRDAAVSSGYFRLKAEIDVIFWITVCRNGRNNMVLA